MPNPSDERERLILSFLSSGEKQRIEIIEFLRWFETVSEDAVDNKLNRLQKYGEIGVEKRNGGTFYHRSDVDDTYPEIVRPKRDADRESVDDEVSSLEQRLDIESDSAPGPLDPPATCMELLQSLLSKSVNFENVVYSDDILDRFLNIFDAYSDRMRRSYAEEDPDRERVLANTTPEREFRLFLHLSRELVSNSKRGQEHPEIRSRLHSRLDEVEEILPRLPPELGVECLALARELYGERGKEFYRQIVTIDEYDNETLEREAFFTYDVRHDRDELVRDLSRLSDVAAEPTAQRMRDLIKNISESYVGRSASQYGE